MSDLLQYISATDSPVIKWLTPEQSAKEEPMIGGDTCHLCGQKIAERHKEFDTTYRKSGAVKHADEYIITCYRCGTMVIEDNGELSVVMGKGCVQKAI